MSISKTVIIEQIRELSAELDRILETLEPKPDGGKIICKAYRGATRFYKRNADGKESYLSTKNADVIATLAGRLYESRMKRAAERERAQLRACLGILCKPDRALSDVNDVLAGINSQLRPYVTPGAMTDDSYAERWQESNVVVKRRRIHAKDDYHQFKTMRGDYVGSKSEAIIADRLFANGIPYHYEIAFVPEAETDRTRPVYDEYGRLAGYEAPGLDPYSKDTLHPDFYVLNKRTRKAYFWEHLGRLQDPKYCTENLNRIVRIVDAGYTIGEEVLLTHEDSLNPLRLETVDEIIIRYLK